MTVTLISPLSSADTLTFIFMDAKALPVSNSMLSPGEHPASSHVVVSGWQSVNIVWPSGLTLDGHRGVGPTPVRAGGQGNPPVGSMSVQ